jgi:hypothetical protein
LIMSNEKLVHSGLNLAVEILAILASHCLAYTKAKSHLHSAAHN